MPTRKWRQNSGTTSLTTSPRSSRTTRCWWRSLPSCLQVRRVLLWHRRVACLGCCWRMLTVTATSQCVVPAARAGAAASTSNGAAVTKRRPSQRYAPTLVVGWSATQWRLAFVRKHTMGAHAGFVVCGSQCNWLVVCGAVSTAAYVYVYWNAFANGVTVQEFQDLPFESYLSLGLAGCTVVTFLVALCVRCARCF